ncbi:MAG: hypothetical protein IT514_01180 [Burkholderiales bacterium]|nr:hypothetical protein [Burkholderiales bacterium]
MGHSSFIGTLAAAVALGFAFAGNPAMAGEDGGKGKGWGASKGHGDRRVDRGERDERRVEVRFGDPQRALVREYYHEVERGGRCPPGLKRKNAACMPPGLARKWKQGRPLPREVIYYEVPQPLVVKLGLPPPGYKYVRVARDILLVAVGTAMVIDAIEDLGRL